jgi:hypothetical protein
MDAAVAGTTLRPENHDEPETSMVLRALLISSGYTPDRSIAQNEPTRFPLPRPTLNPRDANLISRPKLSLTRAGPLTRITSAFVRGASPRVVNVIGGSVSVCRPMLCYQATLTAWWGRSATTPRRLTIAGSRLASTSPSAQRLATQMFL